MYTAQIDSYRNVIVCKGDRERSGYRIAYRGSYQQCLGWKAQHGR